MKRPFLLGTASLTISLLASTASAGGLARPIQEVGAPIGSFSATCPVVEPVVRALQRQGFTGFEVDTGPTQARITAIRGRLLNEFVYDCRTAELLSQAGAQADRAFAPGVRLVRGEDDGDFLSARQYSNAPGVSSVAASPGDRGAQDTDPNDVNGDGTVDRGDDINNDGRIDDVDRASAVSSAGRAASNPNDVNGDGAVDRGDDINNDGRIDDVDRASAVSNAGRAASNPGIVDGDGGLNDINPYRAASGGDGRADRRDNTDRGSVPDNRERRNNGRCQDTADDTSGSNPDENAPHDNCGLGNNDGGTDPDNPGHGDNPAPGQAGGQGNGNGKGPGNGGSQGDGDGSRNGGQGNEGRDNSGRKGRDNGRCQDTADDTSGRDPDENAPHDNCGLGNSDGGTDPDNPAHGDNPAPGQAGGRDAGNGPGNGGQSEKQSKDDQAGKQGKGKGNN